MYNDTAASDLVAVMALIAIFVTAAAILGVTLLSYPPGDAAPAMLARNVTDGEKLSILHDGGDPLVRGHFTILIDGVDRTGKFHLVNASGDEHDTWTSWETGQVLVLNDDMPENAHIQIVAEGVGRTGSAWLLHEFGNGSGTEPAPPQPAAGFTADPTSGSAPLEVQFTETSAGGPTSWSWNFGDGGTSTEENPVYTYINPGVYTVTLTVGNAHGSDTRTKTDYISVATPAIADFTANITSGKAPLAVQFTDHSSGDGITSWSWGFGDGTGSTEQNPVHTYETDGTYNVSLTVENAHSSDTMTKSNYITVTEEHVSQLEVNSVRQTLIGGGYIPANNIEADYSGDFSGSDTTPFVLSKTDSGDSSFNVTLTARNRVWFWFWPWPWPWPWHFEGWQVGDTRYESSTISVPVADGESRTATAYYAIL